MGSEKKRKRRESEAADGVGETTPKAERKKSKKSAKESPALINAELDEPAEIPALVSPIATPMADRKLTKKLFKLVSHAAKGKAVRRGIKEVVLALRKGEKGVCVMAGDVFPVEVIAHLPLLCEEANVPYCYVSRKTDLGSAGLTKRPTSVVLISDKKVEGDVKKELEACRAEVQAIQNLY